MKMLNLIIQTLCVTLVSIGSCREYTANKAFKTDSQRLAISLRSALVLYVTRFKVGGRVVHHLMRRYAVWEKLYLISGRSLSERL